jgi:hypothetical protein
MVSVWKSQTFGKSLETFASRISFLKFLKIHRMVLIFLWISGCFKSVSSKYIKITKKRARVKYGKSKKGKKKHRPPTKEIHRVGHMDIQ